MLLLALPLSMMGQDSSSELSDERVLIGTLSDEQIKERRSQRGFIDFQEVFVPKGTWIVGGSASFATSSFDNYSIAVIQDVTSENYSFDVTPLVCYSINDNSALGVRFKYGRSSYDIESSAINFTMGDSDINLTLNDYAALSHSYSVVGFWRQYIPLGREKRFALYNDFQVEVGGFQSQFTMDTPVVGTFSSGWNLSLGITPGIVAFATNRVAFDVSVGVMGISYTHGEQIHNQVSVGEFDSSVFSFAINIFSVSMGVSVYL